MEVSTHSSARQSLVSSAYQGPTFRLVEQVEWQDLKRQAGLQNLSHPLLVKGALKQWPATENWTFERLAQLRRKDGSEVSTSFQVGLAEQGPSRKAVIGPIAPYLRSLARTEREARAAGRDRDGLLPAHLHERLGRGDRFQLDWSFMKTFSAEQVYISLWHILDEFPELKQDLRVKALWPGLRWDWAYTFIGPMNSVTGIHYDYPTNLFCQFTGVKEFLLFPPDQDPVMRPSRKYDWGGKMSHIDITKLDQQPELAASFARAQGLYARVEPGDALFVPRRTWHTVVSLLPSVSLAVFGLSPRDLVIDGIPSVMLALLHVLGLYGKGNCTCHQMASTG